MVRGTGRTRDMSRADVALRARHAYAFLETAADTQTLHPDRPNVVIANAVMAGIAASDAICGRALGASARGDAHEEAVRLLRSVANVGTQCANDLQRLLAVKTNSTYSPVAMTTKEADNALRWAARLIQAMDDLLLGP